MHQSVPVKIGRLSNGACAAGDLSDHDLLIQHVARILVLKDRLLVTLNRAEDQGEEREQLAAKDTRGAKPYDPSKLLEQPDADLSIAFVPHRPLTKGVLAGTAASASTIDAKTRETLLLAIAHAQAWMDAILSGSKNTLEEIAAEEHLAERYLRRLLQLAFLSPKIIMAIDNGTAPAGLTVSSLLQSLPTAWSDQERMIGIA